MKMGELEKSLHAAERVFGKVEIDSPDQLVIIPEVDWNAVYEYVQETMMDAKRREHATLIFNIAREDANKQRRSVEMTSDHFDSRHDELDDLDELLGFYNSGLLGLIPSPWKKYEKAMDPEWEEYLRLKEKFDD